jgi:MoaA/NifB/PqqE/SkfB family radical SAM enzyme
MCGPWHSTTWRKQEVKFNIKTVHDMPDIVNPMHWLAFIKKKFTLDHVRSISFLGGEPFESPIPLAILRMLKRQRGTLSDVTVHFQTNGSLIPSDELMSLAAECNRVKFNMSIDGVGDRFEYIRYPLRWERIEKTAEHVKGLKLRNIKFFVLATINPLNVYYYNELENWVRETFNDQDLISLKPNKSIGPIALSQTPTSLRDVVLKKFGSDHKVSKLMSNLEVSPINECIQRLDWLDSNRKTNWRTTFPEIADFLNNVK